MKGIVAATIQRTPAGTDRLDRLRELLDDDHEAAAIELMGGLSGPEVQQVFASREFKELALDAFDNDEMYRGVRAMRGDLYPSLEWMFDEGTNWENVRDVVRRAPSGKPRVRGDHWMKEQFVGVCNDAEMAEAVDLLGGTLMQRLRWMEAEGSSWRLVRAKVQATRDGTEKTSLYGDAGMRDFFVSVCNDAEMAEAVDLLGGTLLQKLRWMQAEGSNWELVRRKIQAATDATQKQAVTRDPGMATFFVDVCNREQMWEAVRLLGGNFQWMEREGIFEDCNPTQEQEIFDAHNQGLTMLRNAIAKLAASPLAADVTTALNTHFKSASNWVAQSVRTSLITIRNKLLTATYECEGPGGDCCDTNVLACVYWIFGDIHVCPILFGRGARYQATTIIHEAAHRYLGAFDLGYAHEAGYASHSTLRALLNADPYAELVNAIG